MQKVLDFSPPFQQNENHAKKVKKKAKKASTWLAICYTLQRDKPLTINN